MDRMTTPERLILFVCRHGAARSVLAAAMTRSAARSRALAVETAYRGVEPQDRMSPAVLTLLPDDVSLGAERPRPVTVDDLRAAWRTVTFNLDPEELPGPATNIERWDDVPAVADDPVGAKLAIERHVAALLGEAP
jgi:hypothetical protein